MLNRIDAQDDKNKNVQLKINSDQNLAKTNEYIAETRILSVFDVDNRKGALSEQERKNYKEFRASKEYYIDLYDSNGNKIRYVEDIGDDNYLVYDYKDGKRTTATLFNAVTGKEEHSDFIFNEDGEEIGMVTTENRSETQRIDIQYTKDNKPKKITQTFFIYDGDNNLKGTKEITTTIKYNAQGEIIEQKETEKYTESDNKKLNVNS